MLVDEVDRIMPWTVTDPLGGYSYNASTQQPFYRLLHEDARYAPYVMPWTQHTRIGELSALKCIVYHSLHLFFMSLSSIAFLPRVRGEEVDSRSTIKRSGDECNGRV